MLNDRLWTMFDESFPRIRVKVSSRGPPFMFPLVKHLCNTRNKRSHTCSVAKNITRQERINFLICWNQVNAVNNESKEHSRRVKGWWTSRTGLQIERVSKVIRPDVINGYFQSINTDEAYRAPVRSADTLRMPGTYNDEHSVRNFLIHRKRTAPGPDEFPKMALA